MTERLELIEWRDAFHDAEQTTPADWRDDYIVRTVGWVLVEDEKFVHLAGECLPEKDGYRQTSHIPVPMIVGRTDLTNGRKVDGKAETGASNGEVTLEVPGSGPSLEARVEDRPRPRSRAPGPHR